MDYLAFYPATVLKDHGDMHLDLRPDDPRLPMLVRVPVRVFLPMAYVKVKPGARVLLGFESGDPDKPAAYLWEAGSLLVVEIRTEAGRKVRLDDEQSKTVVTDPAKVVVEAPEVHLGGEGGAQVARVGDTVANGTITTGSGKVFAQ